MRAEAGAVLCKPCQLTAFNSLFEMPVFGDYKERGAGVRTFNSLFEMRPPRCSA